MRRAVQKILDGLARGFFAAAGVVSSITRASLPVSALIVAFVHLVVTATLLRYVGVWTVIPMISLFGLTIVHAMGVVQSYSRALSERDFAEVMRIRTIIEGKGEPRSKAMRALKKVGDGELLLEFEKWEQAAEVFATIELDDIQAIARPGIVSELGYARAHAGDAEEGVRTIERALEQADAQESYPPGKRFHLLRRHGIALSLAGEHARAIEVLAPLREDFHGNTREWAEAFYFLGRSHSAENEFDLAAAALAAAVAGDGPFVGRAWTTLEKILAPDEIAMLRESMRKEREQN